MMETDNRGMRKRVINIQNMKETSQNVKTELETDRMGSKQQIIEEREKD